MGAHNAWAMIGAVLLIFALASVVFFPWPLALVASAVATFASPFVPLAAGVLADTLYLAPHAYGVPLGTLTGGVLALIGFFGRKFFKARILEI